MKKLAGWAVFLMFVGSCSRATNENVSTRNSDVSDKNIVVNNSNVNDSLTQTPNTNTHNSANITMKEFMNANNVPPAANNTVNAANSPNIRSAESLMDALRKRGQGKRGSVAPIDPNARRILTAAPDNSEISTEMNKEGQPIETRVFNNNALLAKVERIYVSLDNPTIKIYLKNGKIVDLRQGKLDNILTASADEILKAAGITPQKSASASKK